MVLCGNVSMVQDFEANKVVVTSWLDLTWLELLAYRHTLKNRVELMEMLVDYYNGQVSGYKKAVKDLIIEKYDKIRNDPRELDYSLAQEKRLYKNFYETRMTYELTTIKPGRVQGCVWKFHRCTTIHSIWFRIG